MNKIVFSRTDEVLGEFAVRPVDPAGDVELLHAWLTHPKSAFWLMQHATVDQVRQQFETIDAARSHDAFLGLHDGQPAFLVERYDPSHTEVAEVFDVRTGDVGMHFLTAPSAAPLHGFTRAVLVTVMDLLFSEPSTRRIVVEPDVRNHAVHALNAAVGFEVVDTVSLAEMDKDAYLSTCTRVQYRSARQGRSPRSERSEDDRVSHGVGEHRPPDAG